ncbi:MAG TPA: DegT/DnrJ/EryC1/StrS family aminotransferase [Candidatus Brocadiia bacterium]|nr:DegT/DnrJ/EryC1/StrS family aminotransferase [Candidatus Brocadiia bacterium]
MPDRNKEAKPQAFVQTAKSVMDGLDRWNQVGEDEANAVRDMALRNELSGGTPVVREFEEEWRRRTGLKYAITTFNGTSSLYSAYFGLKVGPGDEVICPTYTWICTISPVPLLGARPVFAECVPGGVTVDPDDVRRRITSRTRAIVVVHLWGWVCDMDAIMDVSKDTGVPVIEDCSHSHGAFYKGRPVGSIGHVGCWSLQGSKPTSAGEGGVIATNDPEVFDRACLIGQVNRIKGMDLVTNHYQHLQPLGTGMKFRAHPLGIGVAAVQLKKLDALNKRRASFVEEVEAGLTGVPALRPIPSAQGSQRGGYYGFPTLYKPAALDGVPRQTVIEAIRSEGVPVNPGGYELLHRLPYFRDGFDLFGHNRGPICKEDKAGFDAPWAGFKEGDFPISEIAHDNFIFLPVLSDPAPEAASKIVAAIKRGVEKAAKM